MLPSPICYILITLGIGGLTAAIGLREEGHKVTVCLSTPESLMAKGLTC
jgi:hypothetical protein